MRALFLLSLAAAGLTLAACDQTSILAKAQPGECYQVTGKDSLGKPLFSRSATCGDAAVTTPSGGQVSQTEAAVAACPDPEAARAALAATCAKQTAAAKTQASSTTEAASGAPSYIQSSSVRTKTAAGRRRAIATRSTRRVRTQAAQSHNEYARIDQTDQSTSVRHIDETLFAGSASTSQSAQSSRSASGYSVSSSTTYSSSSSASGGYGESSDGQVNCLCQNARGPRGPFDRNGFLTWPGKVAYRPRD